MPTCFSSSLTLQRLATRFDHFYARQEHQPALPRYPAPRPDRNRDRRADPFSGVRIGEASHPGPLSREVLDPLVSVISRLREFRPVLEVCECNANNMSAMIMLGEMQESQGDMVIVTGTIVPHHLSFPEHFRSASLIAPPCSHILRLPREPSACLSVRGRNRADRISFG